MELKDKHIDVLKEISNIGSGNSVTALSELLGKKIVMSPPTVNLVDFKDATEFLGGPEVEMMAVLVHANSDNINGIMIFLVDFIHAKNLVFLMMNKDFSEDFIMGEMEISTIKEIGNILNASYINALAALVNEPISISVPTVAIDMAAAILSVPVIEFGRVSDKALFIKNKFGPEEIDVDGYFLFIPDADSFKHVFNTLGV